MYTLSMSFFVSTSLLLFLSIFAPYYNILKYFHFLYSIKFERKMRNHKINLPFHTQACIYFYIGFRPFVFQLLSNTHMRVTFWHKKIEIFSISKCIYCPLSRINTAFLVVSFYDFNTFI